jgi:hypothetical protein
MSDMNAGRRSCGLTDDGVQEAQNNVVRNPINNNVTSNIVFIDSHEVCIWKGLWSAATENFPDSGQSGISHATRTNVIWTWSTR